jgi:hypothetical protein
VSGAVYRAEEVHRRGAPHGYLREEKSRQPGHDM